MGGGLQHQDPLSHIFVLVGQSNPPLLERLLKLLVLAGTILEFEGVTALCVINTALMFLKHQCPEDPATIQH